MGVKKKKEETEESKQARQVYKYWMNCIKRAIKAQPVKIWEEVEKRYSAEQEEGKDTRPFVNDCRKHHEASMSFLDQQEPSFKITPSEAWLGNEPAEQKAKCDSMYLKYIWREQKCQKAESRKLNSALLVNSGSCLVQFDLKKWMPSLRYLPSRQVLFDLDAGGLLELMTWCGYWEDIPLEQFKSWHPELKSFDEIAKKAGSVLTEEERADLPDDDKVMYSTVTVYHIFAKDSSAVREQKEDGDLKAPDKKLSEELQLDTPRRYLQFVSGHPAPLVDKPDWPFSLDHDEFPISHLGFNQKEGSFYGFTDYQQMQRLDIMSDNMLRDLGIASFWASVRKWLGSKNQMIDRTQINEFLNSAKEAVLDDMLDAEGNPKLVPVERGDINPGLIEMYKLAHDQAKEASAMSELLENAEAQAYKDVTALAARIVDANMHQRINRRLGGPWGYEQSITEDAIKMLEVAHQLVPRLSSVSVMELNEEGERQEVLKDLPWPEALRAIADGGDLIKLGVDSIVGPELANFWGYKEPPQQWRLSTKVMVEPGTTRSITKEQQAAIMKQLYVEVFAPFYELTGKLDLMREFLEMIGKLAQIPNIDNLLPDTAEAKQIGEEIKARQEAEAAAKAETGEAGGQPLNSPEATGGEVQTSQGEPVQAI